MSDDYYARSKILTDIHRLECNLKMIESRCDDSAKEYIKDSFEVLETMKHKTLGKEYELNR